jgi:ubiquinone/menaquinone biosynthesis C-methylase UbiE
MENRDADVDFVATYSQNDQSEDLLIHPVLLGFMGNLEGKRIIDYGCGEGDLAFKLASNGAEVLGVDVSTEMIQSAREKWDNPNLCFEQVYDNEIPADDSSIDSVVSNLVLVMIPSLHGIRKVIEESHRVLRQNGRLVFTITNPSFVDKEFSVYRNIFEDGFRYNEVGQPYQFVLRTENGKEITDPTFRDYHYRWEDYINTVCESGLRLERVKEIIIPESDYPPFAVFCAVK